MQRTSALGQHQVKEKTPRRELGDVFQCHLNTMSSKQCNQVLEFDILIGKS